MAEESSRAEAKQALLSAINEHRKVAQLPPLVFDETASVAADAHCREMVEHNFTSHWGLTGAKPYQRYFDAGCEGHVSENIIGNDAADGKVFETDDAAVQQQMLDAQSSFMEDDDDVNRQNTMNPKHTHVGVGVHCTESAFRYVEVYLDRYVALDNPPSVLDKTELLLTGKVLDAENYGPYALTVYHDPPLVPLEPDALRAEDKTGGYPDFGERQVAVTWPWEMTVDADGSFQIPVAIPEVEAGRYYFQLYIRGEKDSIPYAEHQAGVSVPSEDTICTTGLVASYDGEPIVASAANEADAPPITDLEVLAKGTEVDDAEEEEAPLAPSEGFEQPLVMGDADFKAGGMGTLALCVSRAESTTAIVDLRVLAAADADDANAQLADGFEIIGGNLASVGGGRGPPFVCVCARRAPADESSPLTEVAVAYGAAAAALDSTYTALELPLGAEAPVFVCFKRFSGVGANAEYDDGMQLDPGDVLLDEDDEAVVPGQDAADDDEMTPEELAEAEARAAEAEERRREAQEGAFRRSTLSTDHTFVSILNQPTMQLS